MDDDTDPSLDVDVSEFVPHPRYETGMAIYDDIAVVRLKQEIEFTRFIQVPLKCAFFQPFLN